MANHKVKPEDERILFPIRVRRAIARRADKWRKGNGKRGPMYRGQMVEYALIRLMATDSADSASETKTG